MGGRSSEGGEAVRAFFAVEIEDAARREAAAVARRLGAGPRGSAVRWVRPESYHVTLRFLGRTRHEQIDPLCERARSELAGLGAFEVHLGSLGAFPSARRPRVVVVALEPPEPLEQLGRALERTAVACGFAPEARAFRAHLTLGRVRERGFLVPEEALPPVSSRIDRVVLFQSELSPRGSRYTALRSIALEPDGERFVHPHSTPNPSKGEDA